MDLRLEAEVIWLSVSREINALPKCGGERKQRFDRSYSLRMCKLACRCAIPAPIKALNPSHERIVIPSAFGECYQKNEGLVSTSSRCIENAKPVRSSFRLSPDRRLFVVQLLSQDTRDILDPAEAHCA